MSPRHRFASRPLMLPATAPARPPRGLMTADAAALDLHAELTRFLWVAAAVLGLVLYLERAVGG